MIGWPCPEPPHILWIAKRKFFRPRTVARVRLWLKTLGLALFSIYILSIVVQIGCGPTPAATKFATGTTSGNTKSESK